MLVTARDGDLIPTHEAAERLALTSGKFILWANAHGVDPVTRRRGVYFWSWVEVDAKHEPDPVLMRYVCRACKRQT